MRPIIALTCGESYPLPYVGADGKPYFPQAAPVPRMGVPVSLV